VGVSYGSINLKFRRSKNRDFRVREGLVLRLKALYPDGAEFEFRIFGRLATQIEEGAETLPFAVPTLESDDEQIRTAFECWQDLDEAVGEACWADLDQLQKPADGTTGPDPLPENAEKNG
jgi:hypothetical protein